MTYRLICDSCTDLPSELGADPHVKKVPLTIQIGPETVVDGEDFRQGELLQKMRAWPDAPKTACPAPSMYLEQFLEDGDSYVITLSGVLSGSYNAAMQARAIYREEGAVWYRATRFGGEKDEVLVRQNGIPTYFAADIAYHYNKFAVRGYERVINIWGADHHGHVARLKGAMDAIGLEGDKLDIVLMQLVRLMKDGEPYRMSKRSGRSITLADLIQEIPIDAARYFFNMREPGSSFDFDLDLAVKEQSDNPVYYVQYAHARICSLLRAQAAEGVTVPAQRDVDMSLLSGETETALIKQLSLFCEELRLAARDYDPSHLNRYLVELAGCFHRFYTVCRIKGEEDAVLKARLKLADETRSVLKNGLALLGVEAPEKM